MIDYEKKYRDLLQILAEANDAGLFDLQTSEKASIDSTHRRKIRAALTEKLPEENKQSRTI